MRIAKQRMDDLPGSAELKKLKLFTLGPDDRMAGVTGKYVVMLDHSYGFAEWV